MDGNKTVSAAFTQIEYELTIDKIGQGSVTADVEAPYHYGDTVILTAAPVTGWNFLGWTAGLPAPSTDAEVTLTIVGNTYVRAYFADPANPCSADKLAYDIDVANSSGGGTIALTAGCTYQVMTPIHDPVYGTVGLPVITTPVTLMGVGDRAYIIYGTADTSYPLIIVTDDGALTLIRVTVGGAGTQQTVALESTRRSTPASTEALPQTFTNVKIGNMVTILTQPDSSR